MLAARLLQIGIQRADAKVGFVQRDEPLEVIVVGITSADACFMNGGRYCVLLFHRSPGTHCDCEKWHGIPGVLASRKRPWSWEVLVVIVRAADQTADHPPSTDSVAPVMFAASSLARNTTAAATSESVLGRRDGTRASSGARWSANCAM